MPKWELDLDRIRKEAEEFRAWFEQKHAEIKAELAEIRAELTWMAQQHNKQLNQRLDPNAQESLEASPSFSPRP
ncbi:hypothetical protein BEV13_00390 [Rickettsiella grylli]|uniref:hypothetical protein n=1 Tax=Rickettsiella grylli TaxID=59196 RepID=UPI0008FD7D64|nr:hypothetical protein [Rickettsiella grylli]OJA01085.1 hypothetical protein BEV13_00390 [Rickettsiella grylli]